MNQLLKKLGLPQTLAVPTCIFCGTEFKGDYLSREDRIRAILMYQDRITSQGKKRHRIFFCADCQEDEVKDFTMRCVEEHWQRKLGLYGVVSQGGPNEQ